MQSPVEKAQAVKLRGNKYFKGGKFDQAIRCYTEAIDLCPEDNKTDLATYYQNRAAAYEQQVFILFITVCSHKEHILFLLACMFLRYMSKKKTGNFRNSLVIHRWTSLVE